MKWVFILFLLLYPCIRLSPTSYENCQLRHKRRKSVNLESFSVSRALHQRRLPFNFECLWSQQYFASCLLTVAACKNTSLELLYIFWTLFMKLYIWERSALCKYLTNNSPFLLFLIPENTFNTSHIFNKNHFHMLSLTVCATPYAAVNVYMYVQLFCG